MSNSHRKEYRSRRRNERNICVPRYYVEAESAPLLDVLTPLSDCRHETVEKIMERIISGVSYMCWMDFHNTFLCCGFLCARLISLYFVSFLCLSFRLPRRGLPRPLLTTTGYHACVYIPVTTPELTRSTNTRTSGYHTRY